jgi:hypothetical protein
MDTFDPSLPARISSCQLVLHEVSTVKADRIVKLLFGECEKQWGDTGSPFQQWYRSVTSLPSIGRTRRIAWKNHKRFLPGNIFFRSIDTGRLLPVSCAPIRFQLYAHQSHWEVLDNRGKREDWTSATLLGMVSSVFTICSCILINDCKMHELVLLRSMHDFGCGDVPIIMTNWSTRFNDTAMEYWYELSKREPSDTILDQKRM